jgi:hypothetical protein
LLRLDEPRPSLMFLVHPPSIRSLWCIDGWWFTLASISHPIWCKI